MSEPTPTDIAPIPRPEMLARIYIGFALAWLFVGMASGLTYGLQFIPRLGDALIPPNPEHSVGRMRMAHTGAVLYGFVLNGLIAGALAFWGRPPERRSPSAYISIAGCLSLQVSLALGIGATLYEQSKPIAWAEVAWPYDAWIAASLAVVLIGLIARSADGVSGSRYSSRACITLGLVGGAWALASSALGFAYPARFASLTDGAGLFQVQWINLSLIPAAVGGMLLLTRTSASSGIAWVVFGPLAGAGAYGLQSVGQPVAAFAFTATIAYPLFCAAAAIGLLARGNFDSQIPASSRRWVRLGCLSLLIFSLDRLLMAHAPIAEALRFTDWMVGHHHLAALGVGGSAVFGLIDALEPRARGRSEWRFVRLSAIHFWMTATGLILMVGSLSAAGYVQSGLWRSLAPWIDSVDASAPFWLARLVAGVLITLAQAALFINLFATRRLESEEAVGQALVSEPESPRPSISLPLTAFALASLVWFAIIARVSGGGWNENELTTEQGDRTLIVPEFHDLAEKDYPLAFERHFGEPTAETYLEALALGRDVYRRDGCFNCHTQSVRPGTRDVDRWGRATATGELGAAGPAISGTRRVGPDLAREANRRSNDWHVAHLYKPRSVVPGSVMPAYPWLFERDGERLKPTKDGLALIVYLQALGSEVDADRR